MAHLELPDQPTGPLLELHGQRKRFTIPFGLKTLLEEMTRETLRHNPNNIYAFLADYLEDCLAAREADEIRTGKGRHSWEWRRWSWDGSSLLSNDELISFLAEFKISVEIAQHLATIIQSAYRGFMARKEYHHMQDDHTHRRESLWDEWRHEGNLFVSGRDVQDILSYYGISLFEANAFATKIQSVFRGHFQRKSLEKTNPELAATLHELGITHLEANKHATAIQSLFRGYKARKAKREAGSDGTNFGEEWNGEDEEEEEEFYNEMMKKGNEDEDEHLRESVETAVTDLTDLDEWGSLTGEELDHAAAKIQAGFRGMKARKIVKQMKESLEVDGAEFPKNEQEEAEEKEIDKEKEIPKEQRPKYDAYFPGGYDEKDRIVGKDGMEIPPKFTHEHFGDIDPLAVRKKFSEPRFREKMSFMLKDLNEAKRERLKEHYSTKRTENKSSTTALKISVAPTAEQTAAEEHRKNTHEKLLAEMAAQGHKTITAHTKPSGFLAEMQAVRPEGLPLPSMAPSDNDMEESGDEY